MTEPISVWQVLDSRDGRWGTISVYLARRASHVTGDGEGHNLVLQTRSETIARGPMRLFAETHPQVRQPRPPSPLHPRPRLPSRAPPLKFKDVEALTALQARTEATIRVAAFDEVAKALDSMPRWRFIRRFNLKSQEGRLVTDLRQLRDHWRALERAEFED